MDLIKVHTWERGWECSSGLGHVALHSQAHFLEPAAEGGAGGAVHPEPGAAGSLENLQEELELWQVQYHCLKAEQLPKEISPTKLGIQCQVRPGAVGPQDTGCVPWADSLGLSARSESVLNGICAQRLGVNVTQRPRGSQRHLMGTSSLAGGMC